RVFGYPSTNLLTDLSNDLDSFGGSTGRRRADERGGRADERGGRADERGGRADERGGRADERRRARPCGL
ncbi:MAG: hypothetical protein OEY23_14145, partial [Acidimicrobiia bacterium]|nr:hypothetical protein [Acidimicrobiia bacterium]